MTAATSAVGHTPGPWRAMRLQVYGPGDNRTLKGEESVWGLVAHTYGQDDRAYANARLIAAAPALLEALQNILADCEIAEQRRTAPDWDFACFHAIEYAKAALALARAAEKEGG